MDVLYESEIRGSLPRDSLDQRQRNGWVVPTSDDLSGPLENETSPSDESVAYARQLIEGVQDHHADIDEMLGRYADRWAIERMPVVDRTLLRMAIYEMLWGDDVPVAVVINEAVEMAKALSTDDSGRFVNGLLGQIAENHALNQE